MSYSLEECWMEWIAMAREFRHSNIDCCGPFFSFEPQGYSGHRDRLLLVGKATDGWDWKDGLGLSSGLTELGLALNQRELSRYFREQRAEDKKRHPGFWEFERRLASQFDDCGSSRTNLIWSNLFKISKKPKGNPGGPLAKAQRPLAIKTLRQEIKEYKPTLVIFTTISSRLYDDVVYEIAGLEHQHDWTVEYKDQPNESWALRVSGLPPMLWTRHPGRKSRTTIESWLTRAERISRQH